MPSQPVIMMASDIKLIQPVACFSVLAQFIVSCLHLAIVKGKLLLVLLVDMDALGMMELGQMVELGIEEGGTVLCSELISAVMDSLPDEQKCKESFSGKHSCWGIGCVY